MNNMKTLNIELNEQQVQFLKDIIREVQPQLSNTAMRVSEQVIDKLLEL